MQTVKRATATRAVNEDLKDIAQQLIDRIFDALRQTNVHQGTVLDVTSPNEWRHRTREDIEADLAYLEINRAEILSALSDYLADDSLRSGEIDWLFLNVLTYAEYVATVSEIRKRLMGIYKYVKSMQPPISDHVPSISKIASRPWQTFFALAATILSFLIHPAMAVSIGAIAVYGYWKRKKGVEKIDGVLSSMLQTYTSFNTIDLNWSHVNRALEDSRRKGVVWDASLFKLVEVRQLAV